MPSKDAILELVTFLAANVSVSNEDGDTRKADAYQAMQNTVQALAQRAVDLSGIKIVTLVNEPLANRTPESRPINMVGLWTDGCVADVQDDGRTLKLYPAPKPGIFI